MAPLNDRQIKAFTTESAIRDVPGFLAALAEFDLWSFASRPLDLGWLVQYWRSHQTFDNLAKMLSVNLVERLRETDSERARKVRIEPAMAMKCLERVGAALVLGHQRDIAVAGGDILTDSRDAMRLNEVLEDLTPEKLADFSNAAVFVASGPGVIRLHNDNDGAVRSFLAARWMLQALHNHCPWSVARNLLFAETYGLPVVKPSMLATAVWLSLWEPRVANELASRQPFALLNSGDPSSLPLGTRRKVLRAVIVALESNQRVGFFSMEGLKRFAQADLEPDIRELWGQENANSRSLLLQLIREGKLSGCASVAFDGATSPTCDALVRSLAAQAIARAGDDKMQSQFADFLRRQAPIMDPDVLWNAVEWFAPRWFSPDDVVAALPNLLSNTLSNSAGIEHYGPLLAKRLDAVDGAARLLAALLHNLPSKVNDTYDNVDFHQVMPVMPTVAELAKRIVVLRGPPEAIQIAVDALLRLAAVRRDPDFGAESIQQLSDTIIQTAALRRAFLWRFAETFDVMEWSPGTPLTQSWQLNLTRLSFGLTSEDMDWLLNDLSRRESLHDKLLALNLAMSIWRQENEPETLRQRVEDLAGGAAELLSALSAWTAPQARSAEQILMDENNAKHLAASAERRKMEDASWVQFAAEIRNEPEQLDCLTPPDHRGVDRRIFHLWQLLDRLKGGAQSHSVSDVSLLTPVLGVAALPYVQRAFLRYWRLGSPTLRCESPVKPVSGGNSMEFIGLLGLSMESSQNPQWAKSLSPDEAKLAATFATLELNGFPPWFEGLASEHPNVVGPILDRVLTSELTGETSSEWLEMLERVAKSPESILGLAAPFVFERASSPRISTKALSLASRILINARHRLAEVLAIVLNRAAHEDDMARLAIYLSTACAIDGDAATQALADFRERLSPVDTTALAESLLPAIFGGAQGVAPGGTRLSAISTENLLALIEFAFETFPLEEDRDRPSGKVYSPDNRDHSQRARDSSINLLANRSGAGTFVALLHLASLPRFSAITEWLHQLAVTRARIDSESAPWTPRDVSAFELDFQTFPRTAADLQRVAAAKIDDLQHDLIHGDFGQGRVVAGFTKEVEAQRWFAHELDIKSGRGYSVVREAHSADEKEPDITLTSNGTLAKVPIEIKIAETWSLTQLEEALTSQLMDRYLRDKNAQWGILLLIHCKPRAKGWHPSSGGFLTFAETLVHLQTLAANISAGDAGGPQMKVCAIDVSSVRAIVEGKVE